MTEYYSCIHVAPEAMSKSVKRAREILTARRAKLSSLYYCVQCDFSGTFSDGQLKIHAATTGHAVYIRSKEPVEIYCAVCKDFQFSSMFDKAFRRKRPRSGLHTRSNTSKSSTLLGSSRQVKGLCNMGATCFMSSVLQVLMKNPVLMSCDQMQIPVDRCKTVIDRSQSIDNSSKHSSDTLSHTVFTGIQTCIYCEFQKLIADIQREGAVDTLVPANLLYAVWSELDYMAGYQQQDAHEFFIAFLDGMDKHLRCYHGTGSDGTGSDNSQFNQDTVGVGSKSVLGISTSCSPPLLGTTTTACSYSPVAVRKSPRSPRSDGKLRGDGGCPTGSGDCMGEMFSPAALRRAVSETGPPSAGSMRNTTTTSCAEVLEVFQGSLDSCLTCRSCGHVSVKEEGFLDLSLSLHRAAPIRAMHRRASRSSLGGDALVGSAGDATAPHTQSSRNMSKIVPTTSTVFIETLAEVPVPTTAKPGRGRPKGRKSVSSQSSVVALSPSPLCGSTPLHTILPHPSQQQSLHSSLSNEILSVEPAIVSEEAGEESDLSLSDCLRAFTTLENLNEPIYCENCACNRSMQKQLFVSSPPNVLILHLKRFDVLRDLKISTKVSIPLEDLDIAEFTQSSPGSPTGVSLQDTLYDLQGLVSHIGTLHGGHYIAYTLNHIPGSGHTQRKQWIRCDDEHISIVPEEEVLEAEAPDKTEIH